MCNHHEHHHQHCCSCSNNSSTIFRALAALLLFAGGFKFSILFFLAYIIAGWDVIFKAAKNITKGHVFDENFLMSAATIGALCIKEYPEAVMVMILYQIGEYFQHKAVEKSRHSISELMDIRPDYANLRGEKVSPQEVKVGDIITVNTGEKIPLDGIVTEGHASLDTSALTGESVPRTVSTGDSVISGCINLNGVLKIKVTKEFGESTVTKILELVEHASSKKARTEKFITKFAAYYTPAVVILALMIAFIPPLFITGNWIERALTFLVISCPCALVISIPLSFFAGIGSASKNGILIKGSNYLELLAKPDTVVFDKTGTLTKGVFKVREVHSDEPDFLKYAAYAESASSHPIAAAIREAYGQEIPEQNNIEEIAGLGIKAVIDGKEILAGSAKLVKTEPINTDGTVVYVSINGNYCGYIVIADEVKDDSKETIEKLKTLGIKTVMLTGDSKNTADKVQKKLGVDNAFAELLPEDKVNKLEKIIKTAGGSVIFVGDGINDAPVLTRADVGIAMGGLGSDAAIEAADAVIMDDSPSKLITSIKIARKTMRIVKQNIVFALGVKALFLILGGIGIMTMWGAVFADVGVALLAVLNSLRTLRK